MEQFWFVESSSKNKKKSEYHRDNESFFFIVVVTFCVKSKPHASVLADNELLIDTERDVRKRRIELQVEQQAAGLQMQVKKKKSVCGKNTA